MSTAECAISWMPCSSSVVGNLFLLVAYAALIFGANTYLNQGLDAIAERVQPGIVNGLIFPLLKQASAITFLLAGSIQPSNRSHSDSERWMSASVGGLAGTVVLLLTVVLPAAMHRARTDVDRQIDVDDLQMSQKPWYKLGLVLENDVKRATKIAGGTSLICVFLQGPVFAHESLPSHDASRRESSMLVWGFVLCLVNFIAFGTYHVRNSIVQTQGIQMARVRRHSAKMLSKFLYDLSSHSIQDSGEHSTPHSGIDRDHANIGYSLFTERDISGSSINDGSRGEFSSGHMSGHDTHVVWYITSRVAFGLGVACFFAYPLVSVIVDFSQCSGIGPYYVGFVVVPLATTMHEAANTMQSMQRRSGGQSGLLCSILAVVTVQNTLYLAILVFLVYIQNINWTFSADLIPMFVCSAWIGLLGMKNVVRMWTLVPVMALYPLSIGLVVLCKSCYHGWASH
eukprot:GFYU01018026.1.p1 GENE.GFYU01018026.1~~GFYU01018026.1.p1  ORF type:complete len:455 (+),score=43.84 GFYU01018026.1:162-1526(+)